MTDDSPAGDAFGSPSFAADSPAVDPLGADPLAHRSRATPDRTALVDATTGATWTYRELDARVAATAGSLASAVAAGGDGDPNGVRVAAVVPTRPAFAAVALATLRLGATLVPLNARLTAGELTDRLARVDPAVLVCGSGTAERALNAADCAVLSVDEPDHDSVEFLPTVSPADADDDRPTETARRTETARPTGGEGPADGRGSTDGHGSAGADTTAGAAAGTRTPRSRDTEVLVLFTSGTTGRPKGVRLTLGNLFASAIASAFRLGVTGEDRWLCPLPMYHMGGLAPVLRSVLYGTTVVVQSGFDAERTAAVIETEEVTGVSLVPTMVWRLLEADWVPPSHLRFVLLGGAPAPPELLERALDRGVPVYPTYGMTETASQIATARPDEVATHEGTVGQPLLWTDVTVVDGDGNPCEPGETGEFVVSGPTVTPGYLDAERTAAALGEAGLHTGDVGYRDENGRLWVCNRLDDRIVTGGENVDPGEVVDALRTHPGVADAAVVGVPDPEWGETVAALVVPAAGASPTVESVTAHCRERLAGFKCPRRVAFATSLPRTASGTVDREAVRERLS